MFFAAEPQATSPPGTSDRAIADYSELIRRNPADVSAYISRAISYQRIGDHVSAVADGAEAVRRDADRTDVWSSIFKNSEQVSKAEKFIGEAIVKQEKLAADFPNIPNHRQELAATQNNLGHLYHSVGRSQEAEGAYRRGLALQRETGRRISRRVCLPRGPGTKRSRGTGRPAVEIGHNQEGESLYRRAIVQWEKLRFEFVNEPRYREVLAQDLFNLARMHAAEPGQLQAARHLIDRAITIDEKLAAEFPNDPKYLQSMIGGLGNLTVLLKAAHKLAEAESVCRRTVSMVESPDCGFDDPAYQGERAQAYCTLGDLLLEIGRRSDSEKAYRPTGGRGEKFQGKAVQFRFPRDARYQNDLAWMLATCPMPECRVVDQAVDFASKAVQLAPKIGNYWNTLGVTRYRRGEWTPTIEALKKSMDLRGGGDGYDWFFLAMAYSRLGNKEQARQFYDRAVAGMEKILPENEELWRFRVEAALLLGIELPKQAERAHAG